MRRIVVIIGSKSDLPECFDGLGVLADAQHLGTAEVVSVDVMSCHRNSDELGPYLKELHERGDIDAIIAAAGWAAHLPGWIDAYLRYILKDERIVVVGVGLEDPTSERHTLAAELSISEVPQNQMVHVHGYSPVHARFLRACLAAVEGELPKLKIPTLRPSIKYTFDEAYKVARAAAEQSTTKARS